MAIKASDLRDNLDAILDQVLTTGVPVEIEHNGRILRIVAEPIRSKLARIKPMQLIVGDPEDLVHMEWLKSDH